MYRLRVLFHIVIVVMLFISSASAENILKITLVEDPWPPYIIGQLNSEAQSGVLIDLYKEIFKQIEGVEVQYLLMPWKRALLEVEEGRHDGIMALFKNTARMKVMDFTIPVFTGRTLLWYSNTKYPGGIKWNSMEDLIPYQIVMQRSSAMGKPLQFAVKNGVPLNIYKVTSHIQQFQLLLSGRYDITPLTEIVGYHLLQEHGWNGKIIPMEKPLSLDDQYYLGFSKKTSARKLIPKINAIIEEMKKKGAIDKILRGQVK